LAVRRYDSNNPANSFQINRSAIARAAVLLHPACDAQVSSGAVALSASHVFGSCVTATFTAPFASAMTRNVFASNAMPVRHLACDIDLDARDSRAGVAKIEPSGEIGLDTP